MTSESLKEKIGRWRSRSLSLNSFALSLCHSLYLLHSSSPHFHSTFFFLFFSVLFPLSKCGTLYWLFRRRTYIINFSLYFHSLFFFPMFVTVSFTFNSFSLLHPFFLKTAQFWGWSFNTGSGRRKLHQTQKVKRWKYYSKIEKYGLALLRIGMSKDIRKSL